MLQLWQGLGGLFVRDKMTAPPPPPPVPPGGGSAPSGTAAPTGPPSSAVTAFRLDRWQRGGITSFEETCFSEYWGDLPPLVGRDVSVDPYDFLHRMALGRYLIEHTGGEEVWGAQCRKHWFWAYLAQMDWQWRSGRFLPAGVGPAPDDGDEGAPPLVPKIAPDSWWAYMNMGFIVGAYCGAARAGVVPPVELSGNLSDDPHFKAVVDGWCAFFSGPHAAYLSRGVDLTEHPRAVYPLYDELWGTHSATVRNGLDGARPLEAALPSDELKVGLGWCKMVELFDAMGWPHLSLESLMEDGAGYLPTRRLDGESGGAMDYLREHRKKEYVTVQSLLALYDTPNETLHSMAKFWKRVSRYHSVRSTLPKTVDRVTHGSALTKLVVAFRLVGLAALPQTARECTVLLSMIVAVAAVGNFTRRGRWR